MREIVIRGIKLLLEKQQILIIKPAERENQEEPQHENDIKIQKSG